MYPPSDWLTFPVTLVCLFFPSAQTLQIWSSSHPASCLVAIGMEALCLVTIGAQNPPPPPPSAPTRLSPFCGTCLLGDLFLPNERFSPFPKRRELHGPPRVGNRAPSDVHTFQALVFRAPKLPWDFPPPLSCFFEHLRRPSSSWRGRTQPGSRLRY